MMTKTLVAILVLLCCSVALAGHLHKEAYYQAQWCADNDGILEVILPSGARCDCMTPTHAVEFDFASKWAEAIGQALHYAAQSGHRAGVVLIEEDPERDAKYEERLRSTIKAFDLPIDVDLEGIHHERGPSIPRPTGCGHTVNHAALNSAGDPGGSLLDGFKRKR